MKIPFKRNKDKDIVIISKPDPLACGGTDATLDKSAPKEIKSKDIILFSVNSKLNTWSESGDEEKLIYSISAFAAKTKLGSFLLFETSDYYRENQKSVCSFIKDDIFPSLDKAVKEHDIAKQNGFHSKTHGLPENFGGEVSIKYAGGEEINFSDNQTPVISYKAGAEFAQVFEEYVKSKTVPLPPLEGLKRIIFLEKREQGFTEATLEISPDGTAVNHKSAQYDGGEIFRSEKAFDKDTIADIKNNIERGLLLAWEYLPQRDLNIGNKKTLTFVFGDGTETVIDNRRTVPAQISNCFFAVELELTK